MMSPPSHTGLFAYVQSNDNTLSIRERG